MSIEIDDIKIEILSDSIESYKGYYEVMATIQENHAT